MMQDTTVHIASADLSADIATLGAELRNLSDAYGNALQWDGNPAVWNGRAPILFPIVGRLRDDRYTYDGKTFALPKHGFARRSTFAVVAQSADAVTMRLQASAETRAVYPFEFQLDLTYRIVGALIELAATIANLGDVAMPASFGFHPALHWPLPYGEPREDHVLRFDQPEPKPIRRIDTEGLLLAEPQLTPVVGNTLTLRDDLFADDAVIFDRLANRRLRYGAAAGPSLEVAFADFPLLGVWTKPGAGFLCIEPWQGIADLKDFAGDIRDKPRIIEIAPGAARTLAMSITLHP